MSFGYMWGFGSVDFCGNTGAGKEHANFPQGKAYLILTPLGTVKENDSYDLILRQKGFRVRIITVIDSWDSDTKDELIKLGQMISNLTQAPGDSANKTIEIIPAYSTDGDAINKKYLSCLTLDQQIKFNELVENQESVQKWTMNWIVPIHLTTFPTYLTLSEATTLTGDDDEILTGDDGEILTGG